VKLGQRTAVLALLSALGFAGNMANVPMFFGVDQIFGSIFVLLAAYLLGPVYGLIAGIVAHSYTVILWDHPYAMIGFVLEAVFVGWIARRWEVNLFLADLLYWITIGVPLVLLFYGGVMGMEGVQVTLIALKQPANGLVNAMVANLMLMLLGLSRFHRFFTLPEASLRDLVFTMTIAFVFFSTFLSRTAW